MDAYHRGIQVLERLNDPELLEAYKRYVARLEEILTPEELDAYLESKQHTQSAATSEEEPAVHEVSEAPAVAPDDLATDNKPQEDLEANPDEEAVVNKVANDAEALSLFSRYVALLDNRQLLDPQRFSQHAVDRLRQDEIGVQQDESTAREDKSTG